MEILTQARISLRETFLSKDDKKGKTISPEVDKSEQITQTVTYEKYQGGAIISMDIYENGESYSFTEAHKTE